LFLRDYFPLTRNKKMNFNLLVIITFIKKNPEKVISWILLAIFIGLTSYLVIGEPERKASFSAAGITGEGIREKPVTKASVSMDFEGLLVKKPLTYYSDFIQRNPFVRLPGLVELVTVSGSGKGKGGTVTWKPVRLVYRGYTKTAKGLMAGIEGEGGTYYWVGEGDNIGAWKIIKIDEEKVTLYNKEKNKKLILPLGGGPEERERARKRAEERRIRMQGGRQGNPAVPPGGFKQEFPPGLPPAGR